MGKEIKRYFDVYAAWNYEKEEEALNKKSKEGWQLVKGGCFYSTFRKDTTVYRYKIDFNTKMIRGSIEKERYIEMFAEQGWEFINTTFNGWSYFRKHYKEDLAEGEYEIYTDQESYFEMLNRWIKIGKAMQLFLIILTIAYGIGMIISGYMLWSIVIAIYIGLIAGLRYGVKQMESKCS